MPNKPKPKWRFDIIISVCAMLVSMGTFATFLYQTKIIQEDSKASVYPHLEINRSSTIGKDGEFTFFVRNVGIGPAFLKTMEIKYKGKIYKSKDFENASLPIMFLRSVLPYDSTFPNLGTGSQIPLVIPAGESERFLHSNNPDKDAKILTEIIDEAEIKICYSSVYKDYWTVEKYKQPEECKNCENENLFKPIIK
jgi:hypothetical protein